MKAVVTTLFGLILFGGIYAQRACSSNEYQLNELRKDPSLTAKYASIEQFTQHYIHSSSAISGSSITGRVEGDGTPVIKIPVVVHILYHFPSEDISDATIQTQIAALNRDFRKQNADTTKIPSYFARLAADCKIEFELAKTDPRGRGTSGIIHKYTPITKWEMDDKIKFSSEMGDDAWDAKSYLNIWVGTLNRILGYSSKPGGPDKADGVVLAYSIVGKNDPSNQYGLGRTAVHEIGHWLGLIHLWGDAECGDDQVDDTPKQRGFTSGCPTGIRLSCDNAPYGDMYMDYMDFTSDPCIVMFTYGQMQRMRSLFAEGGARYSILSSRGLNYPSIEEIPTPDTPPSWLYAKIYPNPATTQLTINLDYDARWVGEGLVVVNTMGQTVLKTTITSKEQQLDISSLKPGIYFLRAQKPGDRLMQKFIKM